MKRHCSLRWIRIVVGIVVVWYFKNSHKTTVLMIQCICISCLVYSIDAYTLVSSMSKDFTARNTVGSHLWILPQQAFLPLKFSVLSNLQQIANLQVWVVRKVRPKLPQGVLSVTDVGLMSTTNFIPSNLHRLSSSFEDFFRNKWAVQPGGKLFSMWYLSKQTVHK
jgi:hypothetical protein